MAPREREIAMFNGSRGVCRRNREQLTAVMVRRLKSEIVNADGSRRFPRRDVEPIEVAYPEEERAAHADLATYAMSRSKRAAIRGEGARTAAEFVLLLLKSACLIAAGVREHARAAPAHARQEGGVRRPLAVGGGAVASS
jgi:hypothetical protein